MHFRLRRLAVLAFAFAVLASPVHAGSFPASCSGSYLIDEAGGAQDVWTFAADGTFFGVTSTQALLNFSNQQGSWKKVGADGARGVLIAFVWDADDTLLTIARVEIAFETVGSGCDAIEGSLVVRTFEDGEDPLDPSTDADDPIAEDTFTGRRVRAGA